MNIPSHIQQYTGYTVKRLPLVRDLGTMLAVRLPFYTAHSRLRVVSLYFMYVMCSSYRMSDSSYLYNIYFMYISCVHLYNIIILYFIILCKMCTYMYNKKLFSKKSFELLSTVELAS